MSHSISIATLETVGACKPHCAKLREIYPNGTVVFDMAYYQQMRDKKVNVFWATPLLPPTVRTELALSWFDRALNQQEPSWKAALRTLLTNVDASAAAIQLGQRLFDRRTVDATDPLAVAVAGVGYAAAAMAVKFAEPPPNSDRIMAGMVVLSQWCAQSAAILESTDMDLVLNEMQSSVFQCLEQHGATL